MKQANANDAIAYTSEFLKSLHGVLTKGLGREDARFKPHHEGEWRDGYVEVRDGLHVYHVAPDPADVDALMAERLEYLEANRENPEYPTPILAGVAHFEVAEVHPFADYNGRAARLFATAVFYRERFLSRPLFSPERYYAEDKEAYFAALRAIKQTHTLEAWLEYYVRGLAVEFERVAERVRELAALTSSLPLPVQLTETQERIIALVTTTRTRSVTIAEVSEAVDVSASTASLQLNKLASIGVLRALGATRNRRFRLAAGAPSSGGRPRTWSEARIERRLRALTDQLGSWPTYRDFADARQLPLYAAAQRTGGLGYWRNRIELSPRYAEEEDESPALESQT